MKISPGIVTSAEIRKNQRRLPMMSNTRARLASQPRPAGQPRSRHKLLVAHSVQACLARPVPEHDRAEDRASDDDRAEHRDEDAEDQDEREATNRRRAEEIEDR